MLSTVGGPSGKYRLDLNLMELLLNLLWLAMALPALWIWCRPRRGRQHFGRISSALLLSCILVLLFPTISASDDLQPMRAEAEESGPGKRLVQQAAHHQVSALQHGAGHLSPYLVPTLWPAPGNEQSRPISRASAFFHKLAHAAALDARGPPSVRLA